MSDLPIAFPTEAPQALDIQHDPFPADDHGRARRIPHLGHALLFFAIAGFSLAVSLIVAYAVTGLHTQTAILAHPGLGLAAQGTGYLLALGISVVIFPALWQRRFLDGIQWNALVASRRWPVLAVAGLLLSIAANAAIRFVAVPENAPIDQLIENARIIWGTVFFGVIVGPFMEELAFRGFLLPAIATAYDWLTLERSPAGLQRWESSTAHSTPALVVAAILSSVPFALLHAAQIGYAWGVVCILYGVSLVLSYIRIRTQSLACSTLMHAVYNFVIFAALFAATGGFRHLEKIAH